MTHFLINEDNSITTVDCLDELPTLLADAIKATPLNWVSDIETGVLADIQFPLWDEALQCVVEDTTKLFEQSVADWKIEREAAVNAIVVEVDGYAYQGDETSQTRMTRAIQSLVGDEPITWVTVDNQMIVVTQTELGKALKLAGAEQSRLWTLNRPTGA